MVLDHKLSDEELLDEVAKVLKSTLKINLLVKYIYHEERQKKKNR